jgi:branched-chain amino acid transport system substrate-binding protein
MKPALQERFLQGRFAFVEGGDAIASDLADIPCYGYALFHQPSSKGDLMKRRTASALVLVLIFIAAAVTGCGASASGPRTQVVNLGAIVPLTGSAATFGISSRNGLQLAVDEFNAAGGATIDGIPTTVNAIVEDDTGSPEVGASAGQKLISQDKIIGLIGAVTSKVTQAVAPIMQEASVPTITGTSTNVQVTQVGDYIFRGCFIDPFQGTVMANYVWNTAQLKTAAVLYDNGNDYNLGLAENFRSSFEALGGKVVAFEAFTDEEKTVDYKAQLTNIKAAQPEFLYLPNYYGATALILRQAREMGLDVPAGGGDGWDSPKLVEVGGPAAEGGVFSNHFSKEDPRPEVQSFVTAYRAKYGVDPDALATLNYDAAGLFLKAFADAGTVKGSAIRDAMKGISFQGVTGLLSFDANRNPIKSAVILTIKDGEQRYVTTINP